MPLNTLSHCLGRVREGGVPAADVFMGLRRLGANYRAPAAVQVEPGCILVATESIKWQVGKQKAQSSEQGARHCMAWYRATLRV